jgi:arylsulfatase A-like enzyme
MKRIIMKQNPNILFILTDQQATHTLSCYGAPIAKSPHIDTLAADAVRFDRSYTPSALCTPARASILTGQLPHNHGALYNTGAWSRFTESEVGAGLTTYPKTLRSQGYQTAYCGKWHAGIAPLASDLGFEGFSLADYGIIRSNPEYLEYLKEIGQPHPQRHIEFVAEGGPPEKSGGNTSGWITGTIESSPCHYITNRACTHMEKLLSTGQPWFMAINFWEPHAPYLPTEDYKDLYDPSDIPPWPSFSDVLEKRPALHALLRTTIFPSAKNATWETWAQVLARYYAQAAMVDFQIGRLIQFLKAHNAYEDCLIVFASDHGESVGIHGGTFDKGGMAYEELYRIPLIIKLPGNEHGGTSRQSFASLIDLAPTFAAAAGTTFPSADGLSLLDVLAHGDAAGRQHLIAEDHGHRVPFAQRILWRENLKYVWNLSDIDELYDLEIDPYELHNRIDNPQYSESLRHLRQLLLTEVTTNGDRLGPQCTQMLDPAFVS